MKLVPLSPAEVESGQTAVVCHSFAAEHSSDAVVVWTGRAPWPAPEALQPQIACAAELAVRGFVAVLSMDHSSTDNWQVIPGDTLHAYGRKVEQLFQPGTGPSDAHGLADYVFWRPGTVFVYDQVADGPTHPLAFFLNRPERLAVV